MEKLIEIIHEAKNNNCAMVTYAKLTVEINGGIILYSLGDDECTAGEAIKYLDELLG